MLAKIKYSQLCWASFLVMPMCVCVCVCAVSVYVCLTVNKIHVSENVFHQSTSFLVGAFPLVDR